MGGLILIVGSPFSGKTVSACTFPKPALLLDYDRGFESVRHTTVGGNLVVPDWSEVCVVEMVHEEPISIDLLSPSDKDFKLGRSPEHAKAAVDLVTRLNTILAQLGKDGCIEVDGKKIGPFKTLIIDPLTTLFRTWQDGILAVNNIPALRIGDYKTLERVLFSQFLPTMRSLLSCVEWIIHIDHEVIEKDDLTGAITEFPIGPSYSMGRNLGRCYDAVLRARVESGKYVWRTKPHGRFEGAGTRYNLPDPLSPPTFAELSKYLKEGGDVD